MSDIPWRRSLFEGPSVKKAVPLLIMAGLHFQGKGNSSELQDPSRWFSSYSSPSWHPGLKFLMWLVLRKQFLPSSASLTIPIEHKTWWLRRGGSLKAPLFIAGVKWHGFVLGLWFHGSWLSLYCMANRDRTITQIHNTNTETREHKTWTIVTEVASHMLAVYGQPGGMPANILTLNF